MTITIFILGLLIGSFLNVCIYRIPEKQSIAYPPSHCTKCRTQLKPFDLMPVISFLMLKGKCRYCGERISPQYPLVELFHGSIYLFLFLKFGFTFLFIKYAILSSLLVVIAFIDYKHQIIPDGLLIFGLISGLAFHLLNAPQQSILAGIKGMLLGGGIFLGIALLTHGAMGGGDIKLMGVLGFWLGWTSILMIMFFSFILGAMISVILLLLKIKKRKDSIPFGPFIAIATYITIYWGKDIVSWYFTKFLA